MHQSVRQAIGDDLRQHKVDADQLVTYTTPAVMMPLSSPLRATLVSDWACLYQALIRYPIAKPLYLNNSNDYRHLVPMSRGSCNKIINH